MVEAQLLTNKLVWIQKNQFLSLKPVVLSCWCHQTRWLETISIVYILLQFLLSRSDWTSFSVLLKYGRGPTLEGCAFANFGISSGARRNRTIGVCREAVASNVILVENGSSRYGSGSILVRWIELSNSIEPSNFIEPSSSIELELVRVRFVRSLK